MIKITQLELIALNSITTSDFYENGRGSIVWDYSVYDECPLKGKVRSGVFSSLQQKGIINIQDKEPKYIIDKDNQKKLNPYYSRDCNFGTIYITEEGYNILEGLNLIDSSDRIILDSILN